ncbi:MAG: hypothetical protein QTN59_06280 [Candidatus Electrothrix communis]|nr:MAG: hypothetical protein QTN59_06280 [Candidatus Electrothrix communis]
MPQPAASLSAPNIKENNPMRSSKKLRSEVQNILSQGLSELEIKLYQDLLLEMSTACAAGLEKSRDWLEDSFRKIRLRLTGENTEFLLTLAELLIARSLDLVKAINILEETRNTFSNRYETASSEQEQRKHILSFAEQLGASPAQLRQDRKAFKRWFDFDAVLERCSSEIKDTEYRLAFHLNRIAAVTVTALAAGKGSEDEKRVWRRLDLGSFLEQMIRYPGDPRVRKAAFLSLTRTVRPLNKSVRETMTGNHIISSIYRSAMDPQQDIWIQCEALALLAQISFFSCLEALTVRLSETPAGDDFFVRARAVQIAEGLLPSPAIIDSILALTEHDPSPFVRQAGVRALATAMIKEKSPQTRRNLHQLLHRFIRQDDAPQVRSAGILTIQRFFQEKNDAYLFASALALCREILEKEQDHFVLRVLLHALAESTYTLAGTAKFGTAESLLTAFSPILQQVHQQNNALTVRRWAAQCREKLFIYADKERFALHQEIAQQLRGLSLGKTRRLPRSLIPKSNPNAGRILAVLAQEDAGFTLRQNIFGTHITRGDVSAFKFWRLLYELRHPSPDKRQAHDHTVGRVYPGNTLIPSGIMGELTKTRVPGEPLLVSSEDGWRNYLPLPDEVAASVSGVFSIFGRQITRYCAEGITTITPPRFVLRRWWAALMLMLRFSHYAGLRNWKDGAGFQPNAYVQAMKKLGIIISYISYYEYGAVTSNEQLAPEQTQEQKKDKDEDPAVRRFFLPVFALPFTFTYTLSFSLPQLSFSTFFEKIGRYSAFREYFFSVYENTLYELGLFTAVLILLFVGIRFYLSKKVRSSRKKLALVVGGWGTRGKSGVERLKGALFEAMGHGQLSKSTGCEAMFIHGDNFGKAKEMFLYRPYDKATIWEHHMLIRLASKMHSKIFLWECMGLTPAYVDILQHCWSQDDCSTITNTYPDHEDIQGPAGYDIPQVMTEFIPDKAVLFTTEEHMHPILADGAARRGTIMHRAGWLEAGLLTDDVLARFPYQEHPYNIALTIDLARHLGLEKDVALKEMADRVIPDLGVLKAFPPAEIRTRRLEFVNGMSANERFATLGNWKRMGFERDAAEDNPEIMLTSLVNNRADRVSRSQMFATVLAQDVNPDLYVLIGGNLSGLAGYIHDSWQKKLSSMTLWDAEEQEGAQSPEKKLFQAAQYLRIPVSREAAEQRIQVMLAAILPMADQEGVKEIKETEDIKTSEELEALLQQQGAEAAEALPFIKAVRDRCGEFLAFATKIRQDVYPDVATRSALDREFHLLLNSWFQKKIVIIEDYHASGNQVINRIFQVTPPGMLNRIMGMQNIKGTGLDFVYRWQAWETCWTSLQKLKDNDLRVAEQGLGELVVFQEYGLLCEEAVLQTLDEVGSKPTARNERFQAQLSLIRSRMETTLAQVKKDLGAVRKTNSAAVITGWIEAFLDAGDAVRRKKKAMQIYEDMVTQRISHERAALELKRINKRQKGGWLKLPFFR